MVAGPLSDRFGIQTWFTLGGISCLVISILMIAIKPVLTLDEQPVSQVHTPHVISEMEAI